MEIRVDAAKKYCTVWLTNAEKEDATIRAMLKPLYAANRKKGYFTVVYASGGGDLYADTLTLLKYNRARS